MSVNIIDGAGIQIQTYADILDAIINGTPEVPGLVTIYGADINTGSNTPDGNLINIFALSKEDILQLCVSIYDSFDPDQAVGVALDNIAQLCGIARQGGNYTETLITLVATQSATLTGLDNPALAPFTISDANGNQFYLIDSVSINAGTYGTLAFQAADVGFIQVIPNTITNIVTITPGVATVNNPAAPYLVGEDQETDAAFRIRRQASVALPAQGAFYGLYAGLLSITGLEQVVIFNNTTASTDARGVPAHSIWVIVNGGASGSVADMIYRYLNMGCGMYGTTSVTVTPLYGTGVTISFSTAGYQNFYATMKITSKQGLAVNGSAIQNYLSSNYVLGIYEPADITAIDALIHQYSDDLVADDLGVSLTNGAYGTSVYPTAYNNLLVLPAANVILQ
jgi:uncharacterized phage protein gp47/JayE